VRIRCQGRRGIHTGFLRDLSVSGMFVRILDPELPGRRLEFDLDLQLPGGRRRLSGLGEVAWCRAVYEGPARPPGMGVRLLRLDPEGRQWLAEIFGAGATLPPLHEPLVPPPEALSPRPAGRSEAPGTIGWTAWRRWAALLVLGALAAGAVTGWRWRQPGSPPAVAEPIAPAPVAEESYSDAAELESPASDALAEWLATLGPAGATVGAPPSAAAAPLAEATSEAASAERVEPSLLPASSPWEVQQMARVVAIGWSVSDEGTLLTIAGDGAPDPTRIRSSGIRGESPRRVIQLRGVRGEAYTLEVHSAELLRVRTGYHPEGEGELHVVLDLASAEVEVSPPELAAQEVRLLVRRAATPRAAPSVRGSLGGDSSP
jgi:hypothetical protein